MASSPCDMAHRQGMRKGARLKRITAGVSAAWLLALYLAASPNPTMAIAVQPVAQGPEKPDWESLFDEGDGKSYVLALCQRCHDLKSVALARYDVRGWRSLMARMNTLGAGLESEDMSIIAPYLGKHLGPQKARLDLPIDLNSATSEQVALFPTLTTDETMRIIAAREKKRFRSVADLGGIIPPLKVNRLRPFVVVR